MKNLITLILLILITSPSFACACRSSSPIAIINVLAIIFIGTFLLFALVAYFRDSKNIFRYASIVTFPSILIPFLFVLLVILIDINPDGEYFVGIFLISFIGSLSYAEKKAKNSKLEEIKKNEDLST